MNKPYLLTILFVIFVSSLTLFNWSEKQGALELKENEFKGESEEREDHADGPQEFIKFHQGIRTRADEAKPGYQKNYQLIELQKAKTFASRKAASARTQSGNGVIQFIERGPGNVPGRTRGLLVDPDDATHKTWFAGSASGGIWKTTDAGTSWQWLTSSLPNLATTTLAMAASNHNVIYAGTGEGFGAGDGVRGTGIFKSIDRGNTWSFLSSTNSFADVNRLIVNPSDETMLIAATNDGIYKSVNGGTSWTKVFSGVVQDLRSTPSNFSILYAAQNGIGVIKSIDTGSTWSLSNTGMTPNGRVEIDISPVQPNRVIASAEGSLSGANSDLYVSDDGGSTWYLVTLSLSGKTVNYLSTQGWYDNTVAFSPYNQNVVYVGGTGVYQVTLGSALTGTTGNYTMNENNTASFIALTNFNGTYYGGKLDVGNGINQDSVEIRFGTGKHQSAHRFLVPDGATSGVADANYTYQDYVDVPFEVWDLKKNQQLMVSFRDQDRNGVFDLIGFDNTNSTATLQSREYIFVHNIAYNPTTPSSLLTVNGGQAVQQMYFIWPTLASGATWTPNSLPTSNLQFYFQKINKYSSTVVSVADVYAEYDGKNNSNLVHPDQHNIYPIKQDDAQNKFQLLLANDGGVFLSGISTSPGTTQGEWKKVGNGYNTSQFYGVDKKPGAQEYLGGMQDNATYFTPSGTVSSASTLFRTNSKLSGDGFEALWHSQDPNKLIGGSQYNNFSRSLDGGNSWSSAISGFSLSGSSPDQSKYPFISKLASSKQVPDVIYTVGSEGVWKSTNFGLTWTVTSISGNWQISSFADVEVSRANANVVWAGGGIGSGGSLFLSTDAGKSFTKANDASGFVLGNLTKLASHPNDAKIAYALFSFAKTAKIFRTTDLGQTWNDISGFGSGSSSTTGFPDVAVYSLYVRPDAPNIIWAGTEIGIIESLDNGASWALLTSFPNVPVWDMKGQDNEVVIATHGRGIWTAELQTDQNANFPIPQILATGTSPQSKFVMEVVIPAGYDSTQFIINSQRVGSLISVKDTLIVTIGGLQKGSVTAQLISFKGSAPVYSTQSTGTNLTLQGYKTSFYDYFTSSSNFFSSGFSLQSFGTSNSSLQSTHGYTANKDVSAILLVPTVVSSVNSNISYQDVVLVQPGSTGSVFGQAAFNDYVVVEGTKDGLNWKPIANGYNSSANQAWSTAYNSSATGDISMTVTENFDLRSSFAAKDTLLIRFRLHANSDATTGWGWSIDNLYIQQQPTAVEPDESFDVQLYPNPTSGNFKVRYLLPQDSEIGFQVWDMTGRSLYSKQLGNRSKGTYEEEFDLTDFNNGQYLIKVSTSIDTKTLKFIIHK